jgi:hypothetical protein
VGFTTTLAPGTVITSAPIVAVKTSSNIGAIVGGVVGGWFFIPSPPRYPYSYCLVI